MPQEHLRRPYVHAEIYGLGTFVETSDCLMQFQIVACRDGVDDTDMQFTGQLSPGARNITAKLLDRCEHALCSLVDEFSLLGEFEPAAAAVTEPHAQPTLKLRHLYTDRWLIDIQLRLRSREAAIADNGHKYPEKP
jgi:hypothetical protein